MTTKITDMPLEDRPREKLLQRGASALSNAELLAIFLRTGTQGKSALDLANDLLDEFGNLRSLLAADCEQFCQAKGLGSAKYVQLKACVEMSRRYLRECLERGKVLSSPNGTRQFLQAEFRGRNDEVFAAVLLDNKHRVISFEELYQGSIEEESISQREVIERVLKYNAAALILAHNNPFGVAEPSQADISITQELKKVLNLVDVRVLDHFILGNGYCVSIAEKGLIAD